MALLAQPPVGNVAFGFARPGDLAPPWNEYLNALDLTLRGSGIPLSPLKPLPSPISVVMNPKSGFLTPPWAFYFAGVDQTVRGSGWVLTSLRPLPPTIGWAVANLPSGRLTQPWAEYLSALDAIVRANT